MEYLNSIRRLKLEEFGNSHLERDIEDTKEIYVKEVRIRKNTTSFFISH